MPVTGRMVKIVLFRKDNREQRTENKATRTVVLAHFPRVKYYSERRFMMQIIILISMPKELEKHVE